MLNIRMTVLGTAWRLSDPRKALAPWVRHVLDFQVVNGLVECGGAIRVNSVHSQMHRKGPAQDLLSRRELQVLELVCEGSPSK
jgi:hypothetical protein